MSLLRRAGGIINAEQVVTYRKLYERAQIPSGKLLCVTRRQTAGLLELLP